MTTGSMSTAVQCDLRLLLLLLLLLVVVVELLMVLLLLVLTCDRTSETLSMSGTSNRCSHSVADGC